MRATHLVKNISEEDDKKYIKNIINRSKKFGYKAKVMHLLPVTRMFLSRLLFFNKTIIHLHYCSKGMYLYLKTLGKVDNMHFVYQIYHDMDLSKFSRRNAKLYEDANIFFIKRASAVLFNKISLYHEYCKNYKKYREKFFLIECGYDSDQLTPLPDHKQLGMSTKIYIGQDKSDDFKNTSLTVEAFSYLPSNYTLLSNYTNNNGRHVKRFSENLHLKNRLDFLDGATLESASYDIYIDLLTEDLSIEMLNNLARDVCVIGVRKDLGIKGYFPIKSFLPKVIASQIKSMSPVKMEVDTQTLSRFYSWDARTKQVILIYNYILENKVK